MTTMYSTGWSHLQVADRLVAGGAVLTIMKAMRVHGPGVNGSRSRITRT